MLTPETARAARAWVSVMFPPPIRPMWKGIRVDPQQPIVKKREAIAPNALRASIAGRFYTGNAVRRSHMPAFGPHDNVLRGVIESNSLPALHGGDGHAQRHGMAIPGFHVRVRSFPALHAFHPVPDVGRGGIVRSGICGRRRGGSALRER